ncbi:MAG: response regulator transcription factor [Spirochaetes bacterium]|nr:response regulator transcription factor [Spirochaetota bacterium]
MAGRNLRGGTRQILIVDDHPLICRGLAQLIENEEGLDVCGTADDINAAMNLLAKKKPDAIIVDISLKSSSGLDLIKAVTARHPGIPMIVYSMHDESVFAERALRAGAKGYVMKDQPPEVLIGALRKVLEGNIWFSDAILTRIVSKIAASLPAGSNQAIHSLSDRELEIFQLIGQEFKNSRIAKKLNISVKTVEAHRDHIRKKMGVDDSMELRRIAVEWVQRVNSE